MMKFGMKYIGLLFVFHMACGSENNTEIPEPECREIDDGTFSEDSGWGDADYCAGVSINACYSFFGPNEDACADFISMRTSEVMDEQVSACSRVMSDLNCTTYVGENATVSFGLVSEDRLTLQMAGQLNGNNFDTVLHLNPCQPGCLSGITLQTIDADSQKICEIPRQGQTTCLFPEAAHNVTFREAGATRLNMMLGSGEYLLTAE